MTNAHHAPMDPAGALAALQAELARGQRLRALAMLLSALLVTGPLASLWATEPTLPLRTHLAFGGLVTIGVAWIALGGYLLAVRRPLYAEDRVLATGLAVGATTATGVASIVIAGLRGTALAVGAASMTSALLLAVATALHVQARRRRSALLRRRRELEAAIARQAGGSSSSSS